MSTVMMRREIPPVCFDATECGIEFAGACGDVQAAFLDAFALKVTDPMYGDWPMQCRFIVVEMTERQKERVRSALNTLMDHLMEPAT
jgi:hypothetical protein